MFTISSGHFPFLRPCFTRWCGMEYFPAPIWFCFLISPTHSTKETAANGNSTHSIHMEMSLFINFLLKLQYFGYNMSLCVCVMKNRCDKKKRAATDKDERRERKRWTVIGIERLFFSKGPLSMKSVGYYPTKDKAHANLHQNILAEFQNKNWINYRLFCRFCRTRTVNTLELAMENGRMIGIYGHQILRENINCVGFSRCVIFEHEISCWLFN